MANEGRTRAYRYYQRKRLTVGRTLKLIEDIHLNRLYKFTTTLYDYSKSKWFVGSCVGVPVHFNNESLRIRMYASEENKSAFYGYIARPEMEKIALRYQYIQDYELYKEDLVLLLRYPTKTALLEDALKEGKDGEDVTEQDGCREVSVAGG